MASGHVAQQWDLGSLGRRKGREWLGQGQSGRHFWSEVRVAHRCPMSALGKQLSSDRFPSHGPSIVSHTTWD